VLRSGWLATGPVAARLEEELAGFLGVDHVVTVASGTAALQLALVAAGVGAGDEVITSTFTWPATAAAIEMTGATPVFADVLPGDLNIDPEHAATLVSERTKAIVPVHLAGQLCELAALRPLAPVLVEDAAHALESAFVSPGPAGRTACFSLGATKNITAGQGGFVAADDDELAARVRSLRWLCVRRDRDAGYDVAGAGFRENLPDLNAAIALAQLAQVDDLAARRAEHVHAYDTGLRGLEGIRPLDRAGLHAHHLYVVRVEAGAAGGGRDDYRRELAAAGVECGLHYLPLHELSWYRRYARGPLPVAERAGREVLSLPLSAAHTRAEIDRVVEIVRAVHGRLRG
jgi:dTDP-4-amino-4,6-dideoxygalactose transaminase